MAIYCSLLHCSSNINVNKEKKQGYIALLFRIPIYIFIIAFEHLNWNGIVKYNDTMNRTDHSALFVFLENFMTFPIIVRIFNLGIT